ncbi:MULTISPECIES: hypothetical protein, partial [Rhizobium]|uniref:hypothetical protein n=1 Tax=Rhizobium TaxID=379 RepID=UPI001AEDBD94
ILLHLRQNNAAKKIQSAKTKPAEKSTGLSAVWAARNSSGFSAYLPDQTDVLGCFQNVKLLGLDVFGTVVD